MALKSRETEGPARRRKRKPENPSPKTPPKKKSSPAITIGAVLVVMIIARTTVVKDDGKVPNGKIAPAIVGVMDQIYLGCTVYWFNKGTHLLCGQYIAGQLHDSKNSEIKVTVTNGLRKSFYAVGSNIGDRMVFRFDGDGGIYIKAKTCETNIDKVVVSKINLEALEAKYKPR